MGGLFRSETMQYVFLILNEESSRETLRKIGGDFKKLHIENHGRLDSALYKDNKKRILDCMQWQRRFEDLRTVMKQNGLLPPGVEVKADEPPGLQGDFFDSLDRYFETKMQDLSTQLSVKAETIIKINAEIERSSVLNWSSAIGSDPIGMSDDSSTYGSFGKSDQKSAISDEDPSQQAFSTSLYGTIPSLYLPQFQRLVFRIVKGARNAVVRSTPLQSNKEESDICRDPTTGQKAEKSMFSITVVGAELPRRIRRVCEVFGASVYNVPKTKNGVMQQMTECRKKKVDMDKVLAKTTNEITKTLTLLVRDEDGKHPLVSWERAVEEEIRVSEALQKFYLVDTSERQDQVGSRIASKCWVPEDSFTELDELLRKDSSIPTSLSRIDKKMRQPPTYFKTNMFTGTFQGIVDTYGVANYKEANPGLFTIVTFPFLFGIMYGDIFHGAVLLLGALYMLIWEADFIYQRKIGKMGEIFSMTFGGRYLILLMGVFAIFCGSVYNDCASIPLNVYGSKWISHPYNISTDPNVTHHFYTKSSETYPWGLDPEWSHKANSLQFVNSMKMKFSVVVGVIQMTFGIILGLTNDLHFNDHLSIFFEFLPRVCFMLSTFGYMIFMIIFKMCINWEIPDASREFGPPNLIQTMIKMFLSPTSEIGVQAAPSLYDPDTQSKFQIFLLVVAVISIPLMLFPKALIKHHQWKTKFGSISSPFSINEAENVDHDDEEEHSHDHRTVTKHFQLSEELITTGIHTIEFVLGCVSNTASYLRLWALSLAHAELSEVFWNKMIMQYGLDMYPLGFVGFAVWACATTGVLLCMDVLECFLHALRLHWVEFQNKFYQGEGYKFQPFKLGSD